MAEKIYAAGLRTFAPRPNAPDFVLGALVITPKELFEWMNTEGKEYLTEYEGKKQLRLDILAGKDGGKINLAVNTFKPEPKAEKQEQTKKSETKKEVEPDSDGLPF